MSSSSKGGMFPVCKNSAYASAYVSWPAKSSLTWRKGLCCISVWRQYCSYLGPSRIRRTAGTGNDHDLLAPSVGLCTQLLGHGELLGKLQESDGVEVRCCWSGNVVVQNGRDCSLAVLLEVILNYPGTIHAEDNEITGGLEHWQL